MSRSSQMSMESELDLKNQTILSLERGYNKALEDVQLVQQDLHSARSYIKTLPTQHEIEALKKELINSRDEQAQLTTDLSRLKQKNSKLEAKILNLSETIFNLNSALESKAAEVETLQDTVERWKQRREAAVEAGEITVEDVLADKMNLETQITDMLDYISKREKNYSNKLESLKADMNQEEQRNQSDKNKVLSLQGKLKHLTEQLSESEQKVTKMNETNQILNEDCRQLSSELSAFILRDERRDKIEERIDSCLDSISRCRIDGQKMIRFLQNALQKQFLDPSLLFAASKNESKRLAKTGQNRGTTSIEDLECRAEARIKQVALLEDELNKCQQQMNQLYVSHLSSSLSSQCNVQ